MLSVDYAVAFVHAYMEPHPHALWLPHTRQGGNEDEMSKLINIRSQLRTHVDNNRETNDRRQDNQI